MPPYSISSDRQCSSSGAPTVGLHTASCARELWRRVCLFLSMAAGTGEDEHVGAQLERALVLAVRDRGVALKEAPAQRWRRVRRIIDPLLRAWGIRDSTPRLRRKKGKMSAVHANAIRTSQSKSFPIFSAPLPVHP